MIDKFVDALESGAKELLASGTSNPSVLAVAKLRRAVYNIQEYLNKVDRIQSALLTVAEDGTLTAQYAPKAEPVFEVTAEGIELT